MIDDVDLISRSLDETDNEYSALTELEIMTLCLEDRRYFRHLGIDWASVVRELSRAACGRQFGGASTIEMQFVRTVTNRREATLRRKLREMLLATWVALKYSKLQVLRRYLGIAFFGSGIFGRERAAKKLFGRQAQDLPPMEAAQLAAMLLVPRPLVPDERWVTRLSWRYLYALAIADTLKPILWMQANRRNTSREFTDPKSVGH